MMKIAIMQPYFFPYLGYFQLIQAVDFFVFYNDVNFIKKGWIHRNRILLNGKDFLFTIPCIDASQNRRICDTQVAFDEKEKKRLLNTITQSYRKAPFFDPVFSLVERVVSTESKYLDILAIASVEEVLKYLGVARTIVVSSTRYKNQHLKRADRLIDICATEGFTEYVNALGGKEIYDKAYFESRGVSLAFLRPSLNAYRQFENDFVPGLSILDVIMFNAVDDVKRLLNQYSIE